MSRACRCACHAETIPAGYPVTHDVDGADEAIHTREACALYSPRDGWRERKPGSDWEPCDAMPAWCSAYAERQS